MEISAPILEEMLQKWVLLVDGSSNLKGNRAGIVLEELGDSVLEQFIFFSFQASYNQ